MMKAMLLQMATMRRRCSGGAPMAPLGKKDCRGVGQAQRHQSKAMAFSNIVLIGSTST